MKKHKTKKRNFKHLDACKRDRIEVLIDKGCLQKEIAKVLKVDESTISREVNRRKTKGKYDAERAQKKALVKRCRSKYQGMKMEMNPTLKKEVIKGLKDGRSPDEIYGRMNREKRRPSVGTNAIYKWLYSSYGQRYAKYLCTKRRGKKKQKRKGKREMIPDRISIHDRPKRKKVVEMEGDTFLSPKRSGVKTSVFLGSVVDTHLLVGSKMKDLGGRTMRRAVGRSLKDIEVDRMVLDNGIENRYHASFPVDTYFCDPHSPWQKPHVEGDIGLLRRWCIPKGTNLDEVSERDLRDYLHVFNGKYRKSLGYLSAYEVSLKKGIIKKIPERRRRKLRG